MLTKLGYHLLDGGIARTLPRIRFRRWPIAIITMFAVIVLQRGTPALSRASITHGEAASNRPRWQRDASGVYGIVGWGHAHEQGGVEGGV